MEKLSGNRCRARRWRTIAAFTALTAFSHVEAASPRALTVEVDETRWIGDYGLWSPIMLGIGSPVQPVDLFPSTTGQETLVIGADGCSNDTECQYSRGGIFASNVSTSFQPIGNYSLGSDRSLGGSGAGFYGLDTITIPAQSTLTSQIVGIINSTEYWVGMLGLGVDSTLLGRSNATSFLASLAGGPSPMIPSRSYAFTAGAHYQFKGVPSSLTLGGYDANRGQPSNVTFSLSDDSLQPEVALQTLSVSGFGDSESTDMLEAGEEALVVIDSSTPFLWLPEAVATRLGEHLGLVYNDALDLFFYPNTSYYNTVATSNLAFKFGFSDQLSSPVELWLNIDGLAFTTTNLSQNIANLSDTSDAETTPYFPLRKTSFPIQYTLGRAFLQEAYLIVDYERRNFTLTEANPSTAAATNLVDILPPSQATSTNSSQAPSSGLSVGAEAGIGVGAGLLLCCVFLAAYRSLAHRRQGRIRETLIPEELSAEHKHDGPYSSPRETGSELPTGDDSSSTPITPPSAPSQSRTDRPMSTIPEDVQSPRELPGSSMFPAAELPGSLDLSPRHSRQLPDDQTTTPPSLMSPLSSRESRVPIESSRRVSDLSEVVPIYHARTPKRHSHSTSQSSA